MLIAEFTLQSPILAATFERCSAATLTVESQHTLDDGTVQLLLWADVADAEAFEAALGDDPSVADSDHLATEGSRRLYRISVSDEYAERTVQSRWAELGGTRLSSVGTSRGWETRVQFPEREAFGRFYQACRDSETDIDVDALYDTVARGGDESSPLGLSEKQRRALAAAVEAGYYDVPRSASLESVAGTLGISDQALSERLRRGTKTMVDNADL